MIPVAIYSGILKDLLLPPVLTLPDLYERCHEVFSFTKYCRLMLVLCFPGKADTSAPKQTLMQHDVYVSPIGS